MFVLYFRYLWLFHSSLEFQIQYHILYKFNQYLNQSYYDFINEYRVTQFKKMVADSQYSRYTLTALAELCGFSSRASFFRSFKKSTGVTPNEYIRSIGGTAKEE